MKNVPLFDLNRQNKHLSKNILISWGEILNNNSYTFGEETELFEKKFAKLCGAKYSLGVSSGTDALIITLKAAGINPGDEVITTPCTFSATPDSIALVGAKPIFVDVDPQTGNIDPQEIKKSITSKTKAILLVHLYGIPCEMDKITKIANKNKLMIIEDASQAHGSEYKSQKVGSFGLAACFSLYPSKIIGAFGNAGIITSNDQNFIKKAKIYAHHGVDDDKHTNLEIGYSSLINNLQAAALLHKLPNLEESISQRLQIATKYNQELIKLNLEPMVWPKYVKPSIYLFSFQTKDRQRVVNHFNEKGISTGVYYPTPMHLQPSMAYLKHKRGDFPNAEEFFSKTLSIPVFAELTSEEVGRVIKAIKTMPQC